MKLPSISALKNRGGDGGGPSQLATDLYHDLRDRHLLPVVILLAVGIVAIPFVLGGGSATSPPAPSPSATQLSSELALQSEPAVLVENAGVRDYRRRLRVFREKNPFRQQLSGTGKQKADSLGTDVSQTLSALDTGGAAGAGSGGGASAAPAGFGTDAGLPFSTGGGGGGGGGNSGGKGGSGGSTKTETKYFEYRVDVEFNAQSQKTNLRSGVKTLTLLPSEERPVISFLGATEGGKEAVFLVSPYAGVQGGKCVPSPQNCFFLTLGTAAGDSAAYIDYTDPITSDHTTYVLTLKRIKRVFIKL